MRFSYQAYPVKGIGAAHVAAVFRPTFPIRVIGPLGDALLYGLADTGADETLLPDRFIGPLGVVISPGDRSTIIGIDGGAMIVRYAMVDLEISRRGIVYRWSTRVAFHPGMRAILGQTGFFDHFKATFNGAYRHVTLSPNDPSVKR